jgi:hypothetical protein
MIGPRITFEAARFLLLSIADWLSSSKAAIRLQ